MKIDKAVAWYQKKIGTYDKEQWEKTVEQKILNGIKNLTLKNAKPKTEFIDVDLVRGSTFPKAKPKQTLLTVVRLAILRYFFLPLYAKWWILQTSPQIFLVLLILYITQLISWTAYSFSFRHNNSKNFDYSYPTAEIVIPILLGLTLSLIHSQIVATSSTNTNTRARRKLSFNSFGNKSKDTIKRRKKLSKTRPTDLGNIQINKLSNRPCLINQIKCDNIPNLDHIDSKQNLESKERNIQESLKVEDKNIINVSPKKRNVYWDSPVHNYVVESSLNPLEIELNMTKIEQSESIEETVKNFLDDLISKINHSEIRSTIKQKYVDDDGFESLNGKSSSGEEMQNQMKRSISKICKEFVNQHHGLSDMHVVDNLSILRNRKNRFSSESDMEHKLESKLGNKFGTFKVIDKAKNPKKHDESSEMDEEDDDEDKNLRKRTFDINSTECTTSATEWLGITTNSDECSYSSEFENGDGNSWQQENTPSIILNSGGSSDKISCTIWDDLEMKKAEMTVLDISTSIIEKVEAMPETCDYIYIGCAFSLLLSLAPTLCRLCEITIDEENFAEINYLEIPQLLLEKASFSIVTLLCFAFGNTKWEKTVLILGFLQRFCLNFLLFFLFAVAERTFKQRFLYAKLFSHLTSSRRAQKSNLPHFRLNKVRNIKAWLSVRAYLKRRGPQRSIDVIVSAAFMITLLLLAFLSVEWLKESVTFHSQFTLEALLWSSALGIYLLRFMTLGNKINRKYRSVSVLITEQINLYLQIEQKPNKKEELMVSNSVLKLAADLLKELESPFKISGLSANPYLYTTIKVVILSALSGVLSEMFGFKLKLHKIKIK
ncbi:protein phtf [Condylostylus longicornis]|uniref:protein phtf n=1 Tax=Condylostylus longicornis TaxID=2530218 RepID=UPI00244DC0A4|nr:protein phtf [Condylostylus longicornis]